MKVNKAYINILGLVITIIPLAFPLFKSLSK